MLTQRLLLGSLVEPRARSARTLRSGHSVQSRGFCSSLPDSAASRKEVIQGSGGNTEKQGLKKALSAFNPHDVTTVKAKSITFF